jgi:hypothetical protein
MARSKGTPLRRQESSEYTSSADRTPRTEGLNGRANGHSREALLVKEEKEVKKSEIVVQKTQAGIPQLIMAVLGIYASL